METTAMQNEAFRVLVVDLDEQKGDLIQFGDSTEMLGGSGLGAALFSAYGKPDLPSNHPDQPLIFSIGPLTAYFPLMSKVVLTFKSPYHEQFAESHAGGRMAMAMRFAGYDALVIRGWPKHPLPGRCGRKLDFGGPLPLGPGRHRDRQVAEKDTPKPFGAPQHLENRPCG